jgi:predicted metal-dependent hydrolase
MQHAMSGTLAARDITPRVPEFEFPGDTPRYWLDDDPFSTLLMNALSLTFPEGERFFVASVRALKQHVQDPQLERQVRGFLAQESFHRREHDAFNAYLRKVGIDVDTYYAEVAALLEGTRERGNAHVQLALTCALEHFTAIMAEEWLSSPTLSRGAHESIRPLWTWHAIEELDHKAVAFDVFRAAGGGYFLRVVVMIFATIGFVTKVAQMHVRLLEAERQLGNLGSIARGLWKWWGPRGHFTRLIPGYLRYYRPDFHPWQQDDSALIARHERAKWQNDHQTPSGSIGQDALSSIGFAAPPSTGLAHPGPKPGVR